MNSKRCSTKMRSKFTNNSRAKKHLKKCCCWPCLYPRDSSILCGQIYHDKWQRGRMTTEPVVIEHSILAVALPSWCLYQQVAKLD